MLIVVDDVNVEVEERSLENNEKKGNQGQIKIDMTGQPRNGQKSVADPGS